MISKERRVFGLVTPIHDDSGAELTIRRQGNAFRSLPKCKRLDHARRPRRQIDEAHGVASPDPHPILAMAATDPSALMGAP